MARLKKHAPHAMRDVHPKIMAPSAGCLPRMPAAESMSDPLLKSAKVLKMQTAQGSKLFPHWFEVSRFPAINVPYAECTMDCMISIWADPYVKSVFFPIKSSLPPRTSFPRGHPCKCLRCQQALVFFSQKASQTQAFLQNVWKLSGTTN